MHRSGPFGAASPQKRAALFTWLLVLVCFTLSSSGYLAWLYHLMTFVGPPTIDALAMGGGYACQAFGIGITAACIYRWPNIVGRVTLVSAIALTFACAAPAALSDSYAATLAFGYAMNLLCGCVSAFYLLCLSSLVRADRRGIVFGGAYACSIVASWLISMAQTPLANTPIQLVACALFSIIAVAITIATPLGTMETALRPSASGGRQASGSLVFIDSIVLVNSNGQVASAQPLDATDSTCSSVQPINSQTKPGMSNTSGKWSLIALACLTVLLMSMVKDMGLNFPSADIGPTINLEFSRLFYAVGLLIAGVITDRSRKHGAVLCAAALVTPFALLAISGEPVPSAVLWAVDYLFYGFFSVFRVVLFADLAAQSQRAVLSGFGLLFGRLGDALGTLMCLALASSTIALVTVAGILFAACMFAFYRLFQHLFIPQPALERSEPELFDAFCVTYKLSRREREVLRLVLDGQNNTEAAAVLFIAESTVKSHVRNVLKKTGCKNRTELADLYASERRT